MPNPPDRDGRYAGPLPPCSASYTSAPRGEDPPRTDPYDDDVPRFWEPGPYPAWNTHPGFYCDRNPIADDELYMTYPAATDPSFTGSARVAEGPFPVIVFAHANHDHRCEIFEGYFSLHDHWASWGFVVASVDNTELNCGAASAGNIRKRSDSQLAAVALLDELNDERGGPFEDRLDLDRVVFAGHSRGGGASIFSARAMPETLGVINLQGVHLQTFRARSSPQIPMLGITAGRDVDLNFPKVEPAEDQLDSAYTWVNINGAIHAYTADATPLELDDRPRIHRDDQHRVTQLYTTAFLSELTGLPRRAGAAHEPVRRAREVLYSHRGAILVREELSYFGVYQRWREPGAELWVDHFDSPIEDGDVDHNELGGRHRAEGFIAADEVPTYRPHLNSPDRRYGDSWSLRLWATSPAVFETQLDVDGTLDVTDTPVLQFRARGPDFDPVARVDVEFVAGDATARVSMDEHRGPLPLSNRFQQVVIPLPDAVETAQLTALRFHVSGGQIFIDDLRFTDGAARR